MVGAIILAAGRGLRLRPAVHSVPKGLVEVGDTTLIGRMIEVLRDTGVAPIAIVTGHMASAFDLFATEPGVVTAHNPDYAESGTMQSLTVGLSALMAGTPWASPDDRVMVLNGDIIFERRTIAALLATPSQRSATVVTDIADRGDEVYAGIDDGLLTGISKDRDVIVGAAAEMVGISLLRADTLAAMLHIWHDGAGAERKANYETVMSLVAARAAIGIRHLGDMVWGEVDDAEQLATVRDRVLPEIVRLEECAED